MCSPGGDSVVKMTVTVTILRSHTRFSGVDLE
jgi:hypothetical protein